MASAVAAVERQPMVDDDQPVRAGQCPGAYLPPITHATDGRGRCASCHGWYRILRSGDVGPHKPRKVVRRRTRETTEVASMIRRMIDAHGRRVAAGDEQDLRDLVELRYHLELVIDDVVRQLHYDQGFSWSVIGDILGVTKQAAAQRWGSNR